MCKYAIRYAKIVRNFEFFLMKSFAKVFLIISSLIYFTAATLTAGPARGVNATFTQPDGTTFPAQLKGDEWTKIRTTSEGNVITRDSEGWWCYAVYSQGGEIISTGYRVGHPAPAEILSSSTNGVQLLLIP